MTDTSTLAPRISDNLTGASYVEWSAIFAGAIVASAIIVLMTAFGSAIGLSLVSPYHGSSPVIFYIALGLWFTWITVSSFVAGGYVTGRMRRPVDGATIDEVHVRDGVHGLVVLGCRGGHRHVARDIVDRIRGHHTIAFIRGQRRARACRLGRRGGHRHVARDIVDCIRGHHIVAFIRGQRRRRSGEVRRFFDVVGRRVRRGSDRL